MRTGEQLLSPASTGLSEDIRRKNGLSSQRPTHTHILTLTNTPSKPLQLGVHIYKPWMFLTVLNSIAKHSEIIRK